jgi:hypothetical protein
MVNLADVFVETRIVVVSTAAVRVRARIDLWCGFRLFFRGVICDLHGHDTRRFWLRYIMCRRCDGVHEARSTSFDPSHCFCDLGSVVCEYDFVLGVLVARAINAVAIGLAVESNSKGSFAHTELGFNVGNGPPHTGAEACLRVGQITQLLANLGTVIVQCNLQEVVEKETVYVFLQDLFG